MQKPARHAAPRHACRASPRPPAPRLTRNNRNGAALLHLDHLALRAAASSAHNAVAEAEWVLKLPRAYPSHGLPLYPNWAFSAAAALRLLGREAEGARALRRALLLFPSALPLLLREAMPDVVAAARVRGEWEDALGAEATIEAAGATERTLLRLYVTRHAAHWAAAAPRDWLLREAGFLACELKDATKDNGAAAALRADCAALRAAEYGGAAAAHDEFGDADAADFTSDLPQQLPEEEDNGAPPPGMGAEGAAANRRVARAPRLPGRLVVPREEWVHLDARTHPVLQFFYSLVPWYVPPRAQHQQ